MRGILLAGGSGKRLGPLTKAVGKSLLPVYDKPLIHYPLSTLLQTGVREILVISTPRDTTALRELLGNGNKWGVQLSYAVQERPAGIAQALVLAADFCASDSCCLMLGDNIFHGGNIAQLLEDGATNNGAKILVTRVKDPKRFGVVELDTSYRVLDIQEKPSDPRSDIVAVGMYFFDRHCYKVANTLIPSPRGEYEITDVCRWYLAQGQLTALGMHGVSWFDAGTPDALLQASNFVKSMAERGIDVGRLNRETGVDESSY